MIYIVMGVSGCGKSTVGQLLAERMSIPFYDGDAFHPESNIRKMKSGQPLNDDDRMPWLRTLAGHIREWNQAGDAVLACSALKQSYRDLLAGDDPERVMFIWLDGSVERIRQFMERRAGHFMPSSLLVSQFQTLEKPADALRIYFSSEEDSKPEYIVNEIIRRIHSGETP